MIPTRLYEHLTAYWRMAKEPVRYWRRKRPQYDGYFSAWLAKSQGYFIGCSHDISIEHIFIALQSCAAALIDKLPTDPLSTHRMKPFYFNILTKHNGIMPSLTKVAVNDRLVHILAQYYECLPELSHMGLFVSGYGEPWTDASTPLGTQCLHRDNWDRKHVKVFVNLTDVTEDDGPLCLLPADVSTWLMKKTGHYWNCKPYRDDSEWKRYVSDKDFVKVTGPAGTVAIVDTSACLHYGSRTRKGGQRQVFVIHYTEFSAYSDAVTGEYEDINLPTCPKLAQGLTGRQRLVFRTI